jgi:hypothetical protein
MHWHSITALFFVHDSCNSAVSGLPSVLVNNFIAMGQNFNFFRARSKRPRILRLAWYIQPLMRDATQDSRDSA